MIKKLAAIVLFCGITHASSSANPKLDRFFQLSRTIVDFNTKRDIANTYIVEDKILVGVLTNGEFSHYPTGILYQHANYKPIAEDCLQYGNTVTASPLLLSKIRSKKSFLILKNQNTDFVEEHIPGDAVLDLAKQGLVTVRDFTQRLYEKANVQETLAKMTKVPEMVDFFVVKIVDLSDNKLTEIPPCFFGLFPNAQIYIFTRNPITRLDTTYMKPGLTIVAENTNLDTISSTTLHCSGFTFFIAQTPLTLPRNAHALKALKEKCWVARKNFLQTCFAYCCGQKEPESQESQIFSRIRSNIRFKAIDCSTETQPHQ